MSEAARRQWSDKHTQSLGERKEGDGTAAPTTAAKTNRERKRRTTIPRAGKGREGGAKVGEEKTPRGLIGLRNSDNCRSNPLVLTRLLRFMLAYYDDWALRR